MLLRRFCFCKHMCLTQQWTKPEWLVKHDREGRTWYVNSTTNEKVCYEYQRDISNTTPTPQTDYGKAAVLRRFVKPFFLFFGHSVPTQNCLNSQFCATGAEGY